jgi:hemolysin activation/secretion protein
MRVITLAAAVAAVCAGAAMAQDGGLIIDRDRADRRAPGAELRARPEARPQTEMSRPELAVAPFVLRSLSVEGASLPHGDFDAAIAPLLGRTFDGASLAQIANAIARTYAGSDIALYAIEIPEQDFATGALRVRVREGRVAAVNITGETRGDLELIRHYGAALAAEAPLTRPTMEREFSLISDIPGLATRVSMSNADASGGVRLGLDLDRTPWEYEIGVNTNGSESLGRTQGSFTVIRNGLMRMGDQTRFSLASDSTFNRFRLAALSHRQPIGYNGASITGAISTLRTEPDGGVDGRANAASLVLSYPWIRSYQRNLTVSFGIDGVNSDNAELGETIASERTRVLRGSAALVDANAHRTWVSSATLSQGLDDFGARALDPATTLDFSKLNVQLGYNRALGRRFLTRIAASGQASGDALPASELFTLGGVFGRAFASAAASGDSGFGASAELAWRTNIRWMPETYVFADGGRVWETDRPLDPGVTRDLASAGLGARFALPHDTALDLELAKPLDEPTAEAEGWRFRFGLSTRL